MKSYQNKSFCLITLGCPKNQVDSEVMAGQLKNQGIRLVDDAADADVILINTCGFIEDAKQESIDTILEAIQYKSYPHPKEVYVWGCLSQRYQGQIEKEIPEADGFFGVESFEQMGKYFLSPAYRISPHIHAKRILTTPPHTAYLKIAEGCNHECTFCAIPQFKGAYRSRSAEDIIFEAESLAKQGVKELILIAQDTTRYGTDLSNGLSLASLLRKLVRMQGIEWIRVMYTHPNHIDDGLIDVIANEKKICKYLDMPLQHIAEPVLQAMGRGGNHLTIQRLIEKLRKRIPGLVLRTAFITGFPNESTEYFRELVAFVQNTKFERMGVFIYSPEEGTRAYSLGNPVARAEAEERYTELMEIQQEISEAHNLAMEGKNIQVLIDEFDSDSGIYLGRTQGDCLEIDQTVWVRGKTEPGKIIPVHIDESSAYDLYGSVSVK